MNITILLAIGLLIVTLSLIILFIKHNKLNSSFRNYNPNPVFGPGRYDYGRTRPKLPREVMIENIRRFFTFKWTWYWTTKQYRKERNSRKELSKMMIDSIEKRKKARILTERKSNAEREGRIERDGSHVVIKTKDGNKKLSKNFKTSGTK